MANTYLLRIITHEETVFDGQVELIIAPGSAGYLGVLSHHAPLITSLADGFLTIQDGQAKKTFYHIKGGLLEVSNNEAVILTESLEKASAAQAHQ